MNVHEGLSVEALNFVDSWFQLSISEDGESATRRVEGHGQEKYGNAGNRDARSGFGGAIGDISINGTRRTGPLRFKEISH